MPTWFNYCANSDIFFSIIMIQSTFNIDSNISVIAKINKLRNFAALIFEVSYA